MGLLILHLLQLIQINSDVADNQFTCLCADVHSVHKDKLMHFIREVHLHKLYFELLFSNANSGQWWLVKLVLFLSHGNASVTGGFSFNKDLLIENMLKKNVFTQRVVYDGILNFSQLA